MNAECGCLTGVDCLVVVVDSFDGAYKVGGCLGGETLDAAAAGFLSRRILVDVADLAMARNDPLYLRSNADAMLP
jgi:hypothetical protein